MFLNFCFFLDREGKTLKGTILEEKCQLKGTSERRVGAIPCIVEDP